MSPGGASGASSLAVDHPVEVPAFGDALQVVLAFVLERQAGAIFVQGRDRIAARETVAETLRAGGETGALGADVWAWMRRLVSTGPQ